MGVNKNISILMLFDCVRVNTGLGFHRICNSEKKGGICELMDSHHITSRGTIFGRRGCGEFVYHVSYCDERVVMTIYGFQIFCDVSSGVQGYALIWHMGGVCQYMGAPQRLGFLGGLKNLTPYYLQDTRQVFQVWHNLCSELTSM